MTAYNFSVIQPYTNQLAKFSYGHLYQCEFEFTLVAGLANGDTITTPLGGLPSNGITIMEVEVVSPRLDTNASPTGTFNVGDAGSANRFIASATMGGASTVNQLSTKINQAQVLTSNVVSKGAGYFYADGTSPQLILAVNAAVATAAGSGYIRLKVSFYCDGDQ